MKTIMDESAINRSLIRMTHEIIEKNKGLDKVVLLGIETRGATLAFRMAKLMYQFENIKVPVASLDISYWRDDVKASDQAFRLPISVQDRVVVIVDDVLFKGRTVRAALDGIIYNGRPERVQLAVLVDRGHRELPIRADIVGKNIPTSLNETVKVKLREDDSEECVVLY
ncbi:bifunctional pyr operon transcriptional regulator/uracil phosphoribosyltransferase PyrR [Erysipelothrix rhusiopathiae]|uniref:Bifunctional protein PyrR n=2 Tax=Erysipelothrix TaxID=1647 RepID=E7FUH0_ERYRH|nr:MULTISPECIES: bifunctional pyr operon transcriptional regulator/uracil phosphoribosyltransferase PyrR [Erysipelothrix]UPU39360.1 bifunctional pyr operon transcriptional regulator/uracil phosphoribosyltransferase PyrR [Erysipelothrix sp. Poltava]CAH2761846.1 bifunctional pyr operon transcriptional regulator/uracil phosphoribosyltransferase PyrR [Erysipelothrix sp. A18Y020d]AGN23818.1 bifunctional pyrimidine regulatory protein/uracil phosphoribosyltransferase [Erysipelothrix rhusiopathiae SY102